MSGSEGAEIPDQFFISLSREEAAALDSVVKLGEADRLRRLTNAGRQEFCEFLLESGEFKWGEAAEAAAMLDGARSKDLIRHYVQRATARVEELDDLAVIGGEHSLAGNVSHQLLSLNKTQFRAAWGPIQKFLRQWDNVLGFTLIERPERYHLLTDRVASFARPKRQRKPTSETSDPTEVLPGSNKTKEQLFGEVAATCTGLINRIALSYEPDPGLRRELIQDILLAIWVALPYFRGEASIKTFAASIAQKRSISHLAKRAREPRQVELPADLQDAPPNPEESALRNDQKRQLVDRIQQLPMPQREAAVLAFEGFSASEIATVLGLSPQEASLRSSQAKSTLKRLLDQDPPGTRSRP